jgi:GNAT superfamily N-acetyltransferase
MCPLPRAKAITFWRESLASAARGERVVLVAEDEVSGAVVGTVTVVLAMPDNQPHRADVAKMLVRRSARRRGLGAALMRAAEAAARQAGRSLLVLDTVTGGDAERLYAAGLAAVWGHPRLRPLAARRTVQHHGNVPPVGGRRGGDRTRRCN